MLANLQVPQRATMEESNELTGLCSLVEDEDGTVTFDCTETTLFGPFGVALLASTVALRALQARKTSVIPPRRTETAQFLSEVGLVAFAAGRLTGIGTLEVRRMDALDASYTRAVTAMLVRGVPGMDEENSYPIELCLNELLQNVFEWSISPVGCFVLARWYHRTRSVRIAVVDRGIGIPEALRRGPRKEFRTASDEELIRAAVTTQRLTSRANQVGGLGLKNVAETVSQRGGALTVLSLGAKVSWQADGTKATTVPNFSGTAVELEFRPDAEVDRPYEYIPVF